MAGSQSAAWKTGWTARWPRSAWKAQAASRYYKGWLAAAWAPRRTMGWRLEDGRHPPGPAGLAEAARARWRCCCPESAELEQLLQALAQLPSLHVALRLHAAVHVQQRLLWLKRQAGTFGFADMLQRLDAALAGDNGPALQAGILAQYPVALIDEFQDTSPLQYRLFDQIYRTADNSADSALLLIGDPKQSIYGFRGADIYSYLQAGRRPRAATMCWTPTSAPPRRWSMRSTNGLCRLKCAKARARSCSAPGRAIRCRSRASRPMAARSC
jgi:hypothetical protein